MQKEVIFNLFPICNSNIISKIGFRVHDFVGTDEEKINFLTSRIEEDVKEMLFVKIPESFKVKLPTGEEVIGITHERYNNITHNGTDAIFYEPIFQLFNAPENPLSVSTMYVDGEIKITRRQNFETAPKTKFTEKVTENLTEYYLTKFTTEEGIQLGELINSDFMEAIRLVFQNRKYVSTIKLLMTAIDTFSFLEFGDIKDSFKTWLIKYCDISKVGITVEELWEFRNSILHMTNAHSRKVLNNKIHQLTFYVSDNDIDYLTTNGDSKYFNLITLINTINLGIANWCDSFNTDRTKFEKFCERYDLIISDSRYNSIE